MQLKRILVLISTVGILSSCGLSDLYRGDVYMPWEVKEAQRVEYGIIKSSNEVTIQNKTDMGRAVGQYTGAIVGINVIHHGRNLAKGVGGALLGDIIGNLASEKINQIRALELVILTDTDKEFSTIQKFDPRLIVGTRVRITGGGGKIHVNVIK